MSSSSDVDSVGSLGRKQTQQHSVPTTMYDALILDARLRQALVSVRSLGQHGLTVAALETSGNPPTFFSRWCHQGYVCPANEGSEDYLSYLKHWLTHTGARVLIPASDGTIALLQQYRAQLEQYTRIALATNAALHIAVNKERTLTIAQQLGLHVPHSVLVSSVRDVPSALREIGLPAVVKPLESWVWQKLQGARFASQLVVSPDEAYRAVETLTRLGGSTLFQQFLSGRREAVSFLYANGAIYARFAQWARRTEPPLGGQSVLRQSIAMPPDIGAQAEHLIRAIALEGYSEIEFRRDAAGVPYLMEINPRLSASVEIAVRSGVDFPLLLYQWACGEPIQKIEHYRVGKWMRYLKGDIMTTIETFQQHGRPGVTPPGQALLDFCLSCVKPMSYDYIDWCDPLPAIRASVDFTSNWIGAAMKKRLPFVKKNAQKNA